MHDALKLNACMDGVGTLFADSGAQLACHLRRGPETEHWYAF